jgi:parvulin-like peptidyl-prolyl isomerase
MNPWTCARLALLAVSAAALGCSNLTAPPGEDPRNIPASASAKPAGPSASAPAAAPAADRIGASHVLVAYKGATRARETVTRTKEEARALAGKIAAQARGPDADFATLAKQSSDDPGSGPNGGALGLFTRESMVKPFSDAAFALPVGGVSGVVETDFGFHVIKRTK